MWTNRSNLVVGGVAGKIGGILDDSLNLFVAQIRRGASFNAKIATHELGHVLGSAHTHSCLWPSGPIDSCSTAENGDCFDIPAKSEGTIMSYCDLPAIGGTLRPEFHPLTADIIRGYMTVAERLGGSEANAERRCAMRGTVTFDGAPASNVPLDLIPISTHPHIMPSSRRRSTFSGADGAYTFDSLAPGYYAVAMTSDDWFWEDNYQFTTVRIVTDGIVIFDIPLDGQRTVIRIVDRSPAIPDVAVVWMNDIGQGIMGQMDGGVIEMSVYASQRSSEVMTFLPFTPGVAWEPVQVDVDIAGGGVKEIEVRSQATPEARTIAFRTLERSIDIESGGVAVTPGMGVRLIDDATGQVIQSQDPRNHSIQVFAGVPYGLYRAEPVLDTNRFVNDMLVRFTVSDESLPLFLVSRRPRSAPYTQMFLHAYPESTPYVPITTSFVLGRGDTLDDQVFRFDLPFAVRFGAYETSHIHIHANGYVSFGSPGTFTDIYQPLASADPAYAHIAVLGADLLGTPDARIGVQVQGRSPNRRVIVEWQHMMPYMETPTAGSRLTASLAITEDGAFRLHYGDLVVDAPFEFAVGMRGMDAHDVLSFRADTEAEWSTPSRMNDASARFVLGSGVASRNGRIIELQPDGLTVNERPMNNVRISPQPATGLVAVQLPTSLGDNPTVQLTTILGQVIERSSTSHDGTVLFNVSGLAPGLYAMRIGPWTSTLLIGN